MPNDYSGIKKVRSVNGEQFIDDFKRVYTIVALLPAGGFFNVQKGEVWRVARGHKISYFMTVKFFANGRLVMAIRSYE